jgi:hypothetical protein
LSPDEIIRAIAEKGFVHLPAGRMRELLLESGELADWDAFVRSWDDLGLDTYMADGGRYRKRRHAIYRAVADSPDIARVAHRPHYQSRDYNPLHGGIERWFEPIDAAIGAGPTLTTILRFCRTLFDRLSPATSWDIEVHQFHIEARPDQPGRPTPEGMHRDGVDYVAVLLVRRRNVRSGVTRISDQGGGTLDSFTLAEPLETVLLDDRRIYHGVTPVEPIDPAEPAYRDVLVVTYRRA